MTWGIEEGDVLSVGKLNAVGADVLRDSARFTCNYVRLADVVKQRRLTVVHVTHYGHDRRTRREVCFVLLFLSQRILNFFVDK